MSAPYYRIEERDMEFPCWLHWQGCNWHWIPDENADEFSRGKPSRGFWSPDAPKSPGFDPTAPTTPPGAGEEKPVMSDAAKERWKERGKREEEHGCELRSSPGFSLPPASAGTGTPAAVKKTPLEYVLWLCRAEDSRVTFAELSAANSELIQLRGDLMTAMHNLNTLRPQLSTARQEVEAMKAEIVELKKQITGRWLS